VFSISSQHEKVSPDRNHFAYAPSFSQAASVFSPFPPDHSYYDPLHFLGEHLQTEMEHQVY
jgi:hypothetical protein